uniref:Uncharacterized protein n=1 Tax=Myoviridae sp. ctXwe21 TaxID=2825123 RepID=A0A8S5PY76_9CAUD|nr:MAG TPA: hypothetical protein [Myoviridae sp. ctXwe21]
MCLLWYYIFTYSCGCILCYKCLIYSILCCVYYVFYSMCIL